MVDDGDRRGRLEIIVTLFVFILFPKLDLGARITKKVEEGRWVVHLKEKRWLPASGGDARGSERAL